MVTMTEETPIPRTLEIHPLYVVGVAISLIATGAVLGQTLFAAIAATTGVGVLVGGVLWFVLGIITMLMGIAARRKDVRNE
jgi:hypothetical protein